MKPMRALAATADVFIENFRPGVVAKYGSTTREHQGREGGYHLLLHLGLGRAENGRDAAPTTMWSRPTGMMMMSGDTGCAAPGLPVIDVAAGLLGALSIVSALHQRSRDGIGARIDASMVQASADDPDVPQCQRIPDAAGGISGWATADTRAARRRIPTAAAMAGCPPRPTRQRSFAA